MASLDTQFAKVTLDVPVQGFVVGTIIQYVRVGKQVTVQLLAAGNGTFSLMTDGDGVLPYVDIGIIGELLASDYAKLGVVHYPWIVSEALYPTFYIGGYCELTSDFLAFANFVVGGTPDDLVTEGGHVKNGCLYYVLP